MSPNMFSAEGSAKKEKDEDNKSGVRNNFIGTNAKTLLGDATGDCTNTSTLRIIIPNQLMDTWETTRRSVRIVFLISFSMG